MPIAIELSLGLNYSSDYTTTHKLDTVKIITKLKQDLWSTDTDTPTRWNR